MTPKEQAAAIMKRCREDESSYDLHEYITEAIDDAVKEEREACAKICDQMQNEGEWLAIQIRQRGQS